MVGRVLWSLLLLKFISILSHSRFQWLDFREYNFLSDIYFVYLVLFSKYRKQSHNHPPELELPATRS